MWLCKLLCITYYINKMHSAHLVTCSTYVTLICIQNPFHVACFHYCNKLWLLYNTLWVWELYLQLILKTGILHSVRPVRHTSNYYLLIFSVYCLTCLTWKKNWCVQCIEETETIPTVQVDWKEVIGIYVWPVGHTSNYYLLIFSVHCSTCSTWNKTNVWNAINIHSNWIYQL